ncbi:MAG: outer membrane lipoprotein carrier protein LolA [Verrucomicrobia bacterium]|nr:outer membrane lipoprotein carrier protein LolA [Verrucomicrobiota bacterium]MCF7708616.1 outer membrane lipoprotein carrier protein LolA [Verrucomicrobiota bacterium]
MNSIRCYLLIFVFALPLLAFNARCDDHGLLSALFESRPDIETWSAGFTQTRRFKVLNDPLVSTGRVWFAAPDKFRWELGSPPQTIVIKQAGELLILYPALKRLERYPLSVEKNKPWRKALVLFEAGFPSDETGLTNNFRLLSAKSASNEIHLELEPRDTAAREFINRIYVAFQTNTMSLTSTAVEFADESSLSNEFFEPVINGTLEEGLFEPPEDSGYTIVEPPTNR